MAGRGDVGPSGFGPALRLVRTEKGLTQRELGEAAGLHPNTVAKLERGDQEPAWPLVLKLAKVLGVDCTAFAVAGVPVEPPPAAPRGRPRKQEPDQPAKKKGKKK